jgi:hypothetical protein
MTVVVKQEQVRKYTTDEFLWAKRELVDELVRSALVGQTEAFVDMIMDGQADLTRAGIQDTLRNVKESANEFLSDMIGDLQREVERRLEAAQYGAAVTGIKYDLAGDVVDIEVDVSVAFEPQ